jgi:hypothetical protein
VIPLEYVGDVLDDDGPVPVDLGEPGNVLHQHPRPDGRLGGWRLVVGEQVQLHGPPVVVAANALGDGPVGALRGEPADVRAGMPARVDAGDVGDVVVGVREVGVVRIDGQPPVVGGHHDADAGNELVGPLERLDASCNARGNPAKRFRASIAKCGRQPRQRRPWHAVAPTRVFATGQPMHQTEPVNPLSSPAVGCAADIAKGAFSEG